MRKFIIIALPIVTILLSVLLMLSGTWLKNSSSLGKKITDNINSLGKSIQEEQWEETEKGIMELELNWKRVVRLVQFSVERDEINYFNSNLARLKGAVLAKEKADSLIELHDAFDHWKGLGR